MRHPVVGLTMGDPAGIGPWLVSQVALAHFVRRACHPLVIGDAWVFQQLKGLSARVHPITNPEEAVEGPKVLNVLHVPHPEIRRLVRGRPSGLSGEAAALTLRSAVGLCLQGRVQGLFTGPVSKEALWNSGVKFGGQTEWLAHLCGVSDAEMLMVGGRLKIVLATRHIPMAKVPGALSRQRIQDCVENVVESLRSDFGLRSPRIGVCALNPHAGDGGVLGPEERQVIQPAVRQLARRWKVQGPFAADALFQQAATGAYDLVVAMYHDQAMIALKMHAHEELVNMTVGLPFPRVSPGHGTAYDLALKPQVAQLGPSNAAMKLLLSLLTRFH